MKKKRWSLFLGMWMVLLLALFGCSSDEATTKEAGTDGGSKQAKGSMIKTITDRGKLVAGVNDSVPGFGYVESDGKNTGFDVDFARAIAAGVLGDANAIEFRPLSAQERFTAVQTGEVDVLVRNTTATLNRDAEVGLSFGPVTFYDGQGIIVPADSGIKSLKDLEGARIAVETGTTTELNLADVLRSLGVNYEAVVFDDRDAAVKAYDEGSVDAFTADKSALVSHKSVMKDPDAHIILEENLSKEPLAPAVKDGDVQWADAMSWIIYATIQAEEFGITSKNVDEFLTSDNPEILRLLGKEGNLGSQLGLKADFAYQVIKQVGNYGEIYDRHLGKDSVFELERGLNALYTDGGLHYALPFR